MSIKAVLFDLDGTLLDTAKDFYAIVQTMRAERQLPPLVHEERFRQQVSRGALAMVAYAFNLNMENPQLEPLRDEFLAHYEIRFAEFTKPFTGVLEQLNFLDQVGIRWGVATNKPLRFAAPLMKALGLSARCAVLLCPDHVEKSKPAPDMLLAASKQLAFHPRQIIYVGDDQRDIEAGRAAGMRTIAVRYGYNQAGDNPDNWGADA